VYGKIFDQIFDGTLATKGPWQALVTFEQLIILADKHGTVDMTPEAISRRTTVPLEIIQRGLVALEEPDPDSRTPDEDGRRIVRLSDHRAWGWRLVNHGHYRKIRSEDERREYHKLYQRDRRAKKKAVNSGVNTSTARQQNQPIAVSSKAGSTKQDGKRSTATERPSPFPKSVCDALYETWISVRGAVQYGAFRKAFAPLYPTPGPRYTQAELVEAIKAHAEYVSGLEPREAGFETLHKFVADAQRWVRLGGMPAQLEDGSLTERGRTVFGASL
jgi:hypothetical protein